MSAGFCVPDIPSSETEGSDDVEMASAASSVAGSSGKSSVSLEAIEAMLKRLEALEKENSLLRGAGNSSGVTKRAKARLPDSEKFSGEDLALFPQFLSKLRAKISIDGSVIGDEKEHFWYAFDRLERMAAARIHPWVEHCSNSPKQFTFESFVEQLKTAFSDKAMQQKAVQKLNSIRQGKQPFNEFLNEFNRLLLEANGHDWDDAVKKGYLQKALNEELSDRMISVEDDEFDDYCSQIRGVADRLERKRNRKSGWNSPSTWHTYGSKQRNSGPEVDPDAMDWEATRNAQPRFGSNAQPRPSQSSNRPPAQQGGRQRARWVSQEELRQRRQSGRCLRCGASSHFIGDCPYLPPKRPEGRHRARVPNC